MTFKEYINSARKHLTTCDVINEQIKKIENSVEPKNIQLKKCLILNLYYLSGYVIECSVKYGIFKFYNYSNTADVKLLNKNGINYDKHIKKHKFIFYVDLLNIKCSAIPLIDSKSGISKEVITLFNEWDAGVRYLYNEVPIQLVKSLEYQHVCTFFDYSKKVMEAIRKIN